MSVILRLILVPFLFGVLAGLAGVGVDTTGFFAGRPLGAYFFPTLIVAAVGTGLAERLIGASGRIVGWGGAMAGAAGLCLVLMQRVDRLYLTDPSEITFGLLMTVGIWVFIWLDYQLLHADD